MTKNYSIDTLGGVTTVRFSEEPIMNVIRNAIDDVAENYLSELRLWDLSSEGINLTSTQIGEVAQYEKSKFLIPSKIAVVASKDLAFGLMRMYQVFREDELAEVNIFRTEREARAWLKEQPGQ